MLKEEDCKPGVDVICIKVERDRGPVIKEGCDYSIKAFYVKGTTSFPDEDGNVYVIPFPSISLNELPQGSDGSDWVYNISCFKLKYDPKKLEIFQFKGMPIKEDA